MTPQDKDPDSPSPSSDDMSGNTEPAKSLTLKDYLESATDASRRTRFITIIMIVASVLVLVSVLNSSDEGWITLRNNAIRRNAARYTVRKFPLLCKCDAQVREQRKELCADIEKKEAEKEDDLFWTVNTTDAALRELEGKLTRLGEERGQLNKGQQGGGEISEQISKLENEVKAKRTEKEAACAAERDKLAMFAMSMHRTAAETKYTVRVPFFGVAFDINDVGILGGFGLWIILILLRLSLRSEIVSLRIGFKAAFASGLGQDFYDILAARQVFVFPPLEDKGQKVSVVRGWIEIWWRASKIGKFYRKVKAKSSQLLTRMRSKILSFFSIDEKSPARAFNEGDGADEWRVNQHASLRIIPKGLCLLPFLIYIYQFVFDLRTLPYGIELSQERTRELVIIDSFFLVNILIFGIWCITKWNELDRLWDYYDERTREGSGGTT